MSRHYTSDGYDDPTAGAAMRLKTPEELEMDERVNSTIRRLRREAKEAGFFLIGRIQLQDRKTGRVFR